MKHRSNKKPAAIYKKDQERARSGLMSLVWMLVGAIVAVMVAVALYFSPLFAGFRQVTAQMPTEEPQVQPLQKKPEVNYEFYEVLPKQEFQSTPEGLSAQDKPKLQASVPQTPDVVVEAPQVQSREPVADHDSAPKETTKAKDSKEAAKPAPKDGITIVEEDATYDDVEPKVANKSSTYILQIRSYTSSEEADKKRAEALVAGVDVVVVPRQGADGTPLYQVISKPFATREAAAEARAKLKNNSIDALVVEQKR